MFALEGVFVYPRLEDELKAAKVREIGRKNFIGKLQVLGVRGRVIRL